MISGVCARKELCCLMMRGIQEPELAMQLGTLELISQTSVSFFLYLKHIPTEAVS